MLVEFSVENHLSFKDRVTLSMVASKDTTLPDRVIKNAGGTGIDLLKAVAIYGPNASGKTNLLRALDFAANFIIRSAPGGFAGGGTGRAAFAMDEESMEGPSRFRMACIPTDLERETTDSPGVVELEFELDDSIVLSESLHVANPEGRRRRVFSRTFDHVAKQHRFVFGREWKPSMRPIERLTRDNALFVSAAATWGSDICARVTRYLQRRIDFGAGRAEDENWTLHPELCPIDELTPFVKSNDVGLAGVLVEETRPDAPDFHTKRVRYAYLGRKKTGEFVPVELPDHAQSEGTKRLVRMFAPIKAARDFRSLVLIDELDAHLHPLASKNVLEHFFIGDPERSGGQVIFTTHDTELMDLKFLRRDQICLMEKNAEGASELYSLWDFEEENGEKIRKDADVRSRYMVGRYGAIPIIR